MQSNWDWALPLSAAAYSLMLPLSVLALSWLIGKHVPLSPHADEDRLIADRFCDTAALAAFDESVEDNRRRHRDAVLSQYVQAYLAAVAAGDPRAAEAHLLALERTQAHWLADGAEGTSEDVAAEGAPLHEKASVRPFHRRVLWRQPGRRDRPAA